MEEQQFQEELRDIFNSLDFLAEIDEYPIIVNEVFTFEESGILTKNKGLVVELNDGSEFQITIVRSK